MKTALVLVLISFMSSGWIAQPNTAVAGALTVRLTGFTHSSGSAMVALTDSRGFLGAAPALRAQSVTIRDGQATCVFAGVPHGRYAIQAYHDQNNNRRLDRNVFGIPSEPYGFSNDARSSFRPPSYEEAAFTLATESMTLEVRIR